MSGAPIEVLGRVPLFADLDESELREIATRVQGAALREG